MATASARRRLARCITAASARAKTTTFARDWLGQAADRGVASALYRLGTMYAEGDGVNRDVYRGCDYLRQADSLGHPGADREMHKYCSRN